MFAHATADLRLREDVSPSPDGQQGRFPPFGESGLLDRLQSAVALFDGDAKLLWLNRYAERMLACSRSVDLREGRVHWHDAIARDRFVRSLHAAARGQGSAFVFRSAANPPTTVLVIPVSPTAAPQPRRPLSLVSDSTDRRLFACVAAVFGARAGLDSATLGTFASLYDLTGAETRVLQELVEERSPREIAQAIGVGIRTIRTQLSSIYSKVGVDSQRELLALMLRFPPFALS